MTPGIRGAAELVAAVAAVAGGVVGWLRVESTVAVAPVASGEPVTTSLVYDPPMLLLTLLCATTAGVLAVVGTARLRRVRRDRRVGCSAE